MMLPWAAKKQLIFFFVFLLIIIIVLILIWVSFNSATCSDNKQNQKETGVDCGGPCNVCLGEIKNIIVLWSKVFELKNGVYEAAALVDNPNLFLGSRLLRYKFKLYDSNNILITIKEGTTFINPDERFLIIESNIDAGKRIPSRAFFEIEENLLWERIEKEKFQIIVSDKQFLNKPFPKLIVRVDNKSLFEIKNIEGAAVLYDKNKNSKAVSFTKISDIGPESWKQIIFTWSKSFEEEPDSSEIFLRTNLTQ